MYKLLVVDDEPLTREYLQRNITSIDERWEVCGEAADGVEALEFLSCNKVDLVVTDIKMPEMDGIKLAENISGLYPQLKVVILSGYDEFAFAREAMRFGVKDYLLKPIVSQELQSVLKKISKQIENEQNKELAFKALSNLSNDYKDQIVKNILKAIISNSNVEIKALYPLMHKLKINIIDSEGIIMLLSLDKEKVLEKLIPPSEISAFNYILAQTATEVVEETMSGYVLLDDIENIVIFLTAENGEEVLKKCNEAYSTISDFISRHTGLTVTCSIGSPQIHLLQLNVSYAEALDVISGKVTAGTGILHSFVDKRNCTGKLYTLQRIVSSIKSGLLDNNGIACRVSIQDLIEQMEDFDLPTVLRYGVYLIDSMVQLRKDHPAELVELSYKTLQGIAYDNGITKEKAINLFNEIVKLYQANPLSVNSPEDSQSIIARTKDFIYSHYSEPISLAQISEHLNISSCYLSSIFHKFTGESYIRFLTRVRMEQAAKFLRQVPAVKIYEVSEKVGYVSVKHFSYVFKQHFGMTPGEFQSGKSG